MKQFDTKKFKKARIAGDWSYEVISSRMRVVGVGVSYNTIRNWEVGRSVPDANEVVALAEVLEIDPQSLYSEKKGGRVAVPTSRFGLAISAALIVALSGGAAEATVNMEAIKQIESGGNPKAWNKRTNARGLYQITPICLAHYHAVVGNLWITEKNLFDPEINTMVAAWYFSWLEGQGLDDIEQVAAFNWGIGNVRKWLRDEKDLPKETQDYLTKYQALTADPCSDVRGCEGGVA